MKSNRSVALIGTFTVLLYIGVILSGPFLKDLSFDHSHLANTMGLGPQQPGLPPNPQAHWTPDWHAPATDSIPYSHANDAIRRGALIFDETSLYASDNVGGKISCANCHAEGGIQPYAAPMVDLPQQFPWYSKRVGHKISLKQRIQECFVRSENGKPLDPNGATMTDILAYINWLSQPQPGHKPFVGRGLINLPPLHPNPANGEQIYRAQCAGCHGNDGLGRLPVFPPLWGPQSFNDAAGMNKIQKMAAFVQHNMPRNRKGILTPQQAYDVSAYIHQQRRPAFNPAYKNY